MGNNPQSDAEPFDFSAYESQPLISDDRTPSVPPNSAYPQVEQLSSGLAPMGQVAMEGRAYRGLSRGRVPWGIILFSWAFLALPLLFLSAYLIHETIRVLLTTPLDLPTVAAAIALLALCLMEPTAILLIVSRATIHKILASRRP